MNNSEQVNVNREDNRLYSRSGRMSSNIQNQHEVSLNTKVPKSHKFLLLVLSLIVGCLSVAVPIFTDWANSVQSQNLYIGLMFTKGQLPFTDLFATGGFLYYTIIALAYWLGSSLWFVPIQVIAFYVSGIYFYKLVNYFNDSQKVALSFSFIFYLLNLGLGFGGLYPIQLAMPFVLVSLWFLTKYFAGIIKDEAFILYGFTLAIAMLLEPHTLVFALLSFIAVAIYNVKEKHFARGFYQLLCIIWGIILVIYTAGYFILNLQILSSYIAQAIIYHFTYFATSDANIGLTIIFQLVLALASGLLLGFISFFKNIKDSSDTFAKWLIFLVFLLYLVITVLSQSYDFYHSLTLLPFGLILTSFGIGRRYQQSFSQTSHRRKKQRDSQKGAFNLFLSNHFFLPLIVLLIGIGQPVINSFLSMSTNTERGEITTYLKNKVANNDTIYVWDDSAKIYLQSKLTSSSQFSLPVVNTTKKSNAKLLEDELLQHSATYVVVNKKLSLSSTLKKDLATNYKEITINQVSDFTVYQKN